MLENPVDSPLLVGFVRRCLFGRRTGSDNVRDAENQQERLRQSRPNRLELRILRDHTPTISVSNEMKIWSDPCGDVGRPAETTGPPTETCADSAGS